jgi:uncharacterized protein (TIGR02145 family)
MKKSLSKAILTGLMCTAAIACMSIFNACENTPEQPPVDETIAVDVVTLDKPTLPLVVGDEATLIATVKPDNATNRNVTWSSAPESVATVDDNGLVKAIAPGEATVTVTTEDGQKTARCVVMVSAAPVPVTGVTLNKPSLDLTEGEDEILIATVNPAGATNKNVTWSSSAPAIATVDDNGLVRAVAPGDAVITVTSAADNTKTATCTVKVEPAFIAVTSVVIDEETLELTVDDKVTLTAEVLPGDATNPAVKWSSSDETVATVDENTGEVTALKAGDTIITATAGDMSDTCEVTVNAKVVQHPVFGVVSFRTNTVWVLGSQTWSDVVMVSNARGKTTFSGNNNVDFKENVSGGVTYGDLFSVKAVNDHADVLCPDEWRVPSQSDFCPLDATLNPTDPKCPLSRLGNKTMAQKYIDEWGAEYCGIYENSRSAMNYVGVRAIYWTSTPNNAANYYLYISTGGDTRVTTTSSSVDGIALRCVKDNE